MPTTIWRPDVPFSHLPRASAVDEFETRAVLKAAVNANTAPSQLDQAAAATPSPARAYLAMFSVAKCPMPLAAVTPRNGRRSRSLPLG